CVDRCAVSPCAVCMNPIGITHNALLFFFGFFSFFSGASGGSSSFLPSGDPAEAAADAPAAAGVNAGVTIVWSSSFLLSLTYGVVFLWYCFESLRTGCTYL